MSTQVNTRNFTALVGGTPSEVLGMNNARKFLQLANNSLSGATLRYKIGSPFSTPTNEVQGIAFDGTATGGSWTIAFDGKDTGPMPFDLNAAGVTGALEAMTNIGARNVVATGTPANGFVLTFGGTMAELPHPLVTVVSALTSDALSQPAIQNIPSLNAAGVPTMPTAGAFTLKDASGNETASLAFGITTANLKTAVNGLGDINGDLDTVARNSAGTWTLTFGATANGPVPLLVLGENTLTTNADLASQEEGLYAAPAPKGGTYKLGVGNKTTAALAFNASSATIQAALRALSTVGGANLDVSGTSLLTGFALTYKAAKANMAMPPLVAYQVDLADAVASPSKSTLETVMLRTVVAVPGQGLTTLTPTPYSLQNGVADVDIAGIVTRVALGVAQVFDGMVLSAGVPAVFDTTIPTDKVYAVCDQPNTVMEIWEG